MQILNDTRLHGFAHKQLLHILGLDFRRRKGTAVLVFLTTSLQV